MYRFNESEYLMKTIYEMSVEIDNETSYFQSNMFESVSVFWDLAQFYAVKGYLVTVSPAIDPAITGVAQV